MKNTLKLRRGAAEHPAFPLHAIWRWGRNRKGTIISPRTDTSRRRHFPGERGTARLPGAARRAPQVTGARAPAEPSRWDGDVRLFPARADPRGCNKTPQPTVPPLSLFSSPLFPTRESLGWPPRSPSRPHYRSSREPRRGGTPRPSPSTHTHTCPPTHQPPLVGAPRSRGPWRVTPRPAVPPRENATATANSLVLSPFP